MRGLCKLTLAGLGVALLAGCGGGGSASPFPVAGINGLNTVPQGSPTLNPAPTPTPGPVVTLGTPPAAGVTGKVQYERAPQLNSGALDLFHPVTQPVRFAVVELVDGSGNVLSTTTTDANGNFTFASAPATAQVDVLAETTTTPTSHVLTPGTLPAMRVVEAGGVSGDSNALLGMETDAITTPANVTITAPTGFNPITNEYFGTANRVAAPFAILDTAVTVFQQVAATSPAATFKPLTYNWSPTFGSGAFTNGTTVQLSGQADVDTDEFDVNVISHETGHYVNEMVGRNDSEDGNHFIPGFELDPAVAWSEGWADAFGVITQLGTTGNNTIARDSLGPHEADGFGFDLAVSPDATSDPVPGWYSEVSVAETVFGAATNLTTGGLDLGLGPLLQALAAQASTQARTTIFSFVNPLQTQTGQSLSGLLARVSIDPVVDDFGSTETHNGGDANALPIYNVATVNGLPVTITFAAGLEFNLLLSNRTVIFQGTGNPVTVTADPGASGDFLTMEALDRGVIQGSPQFFGGAPQTFTFNTVNGETYVLWLEDFFGTGGNTSVTITVKS